MFYFVLFCFETPVKAAILQTMLPMACVPIVSQFQGIEVQNQDDGRAMFSLKALREAPQVARNLWCFGLQSHVITQHSYHVSVSTLPSCYKDVSHWIRPTLIQYTLIFTWLYLQRPYFQMRSWEFTYSAGWDFNVTLVNMSLYLENFILKILQGFLHTRSCHL